MVEIYNMIAEVEAVQRKQHNVDKMFKERRMRVSILKFRSGIHFSFFLAVQDSSIGDIVTHSLIK